MRTILRDSLPALARRASRVVSGAALALSLLIGMVPPVTSHALAGSTSILALGTYIDDPNLGGNAPCDAAAMDNYSALVGRMPAVVMMEQSWGEQYNAFATRCLGYVTARGAVPMIAWFSGGSSAADPTYKLTQIIGGAFDGYIRQYALDAKIWGHPFFLRFDSEMNGNWSAWGTQPGNPNRNTPANFVAAWRHVHDIFASVGAANAIWVWSPNIFNPGATPSLSSIYPGDAYVDWVGLDGYNDGTDTNAGHSGWQTFTQLFGYSYDALAALTGKPIMIGETASAEKSNNAVTQNKATWITSAFLAEIPSRFPRLRLITWFDKDKETDWRVNSSPAALAAYRTVVASPLYQGPVLGIVPPAPVTPPTAAAPPSPRGRWASG